MPLAINYPWWTSAYKVTWHFLITGSCKIMWQTKSITSLLSKCIWPPTLAGWQLAFREFCLPSHETLYYMVLLDQVTN